MVDGHCGDVGIADQIAVGLALNQQLMESLPVLGCRLDDADVGALEPTADSVGGLLDRQWPGEDPWIGRDADEC